MTYWVDASGNVHSYGSIYNDDSSYVPIGSDESYSLVDNNQIMSGNVTYYLVTYNYTGTDPNASYHVNYATSTTVNNCYEATCSYTISAGFDNGQTDTDGSVQAGKNFSVTVTMNNTGSNDIADPMDPSYAYSISATQDNGGNYVGHGMGQGDIGVGQSITQTFTFTAPSSLTSYGLNLYPDYWGRREINSDTSYRCSGPTITTYEPFTLTPTATMQPANGATDENPTTVNYSTYVTNSGAQVNLPAGTEDVSKVYYVPIGESEEDHVGPVYSNSYAPGGPDYTISPGSWSPSGYIAGDKYCAEITLNYNGGYVNSGGSTIYDTTTATSGGTVIPLDSTQCVTVVDEPYVSVYGADVSAGGGFDGGPSDAHGGVYTNSYSRNSPLTLSGGSGTQFGALAAGPIDGFASATLRSSAPTGPLGLSLANTVNTSGSNNQDADNLGGDLGATNTITNYFADMPSGTNNSPLATATVGNSGGAQEYTPAGGTLTLNGNSSIGNGVREAIYVNGNVVITGNIKYTTTAYSGNDPIDALPSFYLIATGNIYIDSGVSQLDGVYVAQPDLNGNNGGIYTCYSGNPSSPRYAESDIFNNCQNQLLVNGGFVSQAAYLDRSFGSLRDSTGSDILRPGTNKTCVYSTNDANNISNLGTCAAEIFNYSPELYLTVPDITPTSGPTLGKYDYVTSLSPVL